MSRMFDNFNEKLQNGISEDGKLQFSFEKLRCEHQRLAKVVATGNEIFSPFLGFIVASSLAEIATLLYQITRYSSQPGVVIICAIWFFICGGSIGVLFWFAVHIHEQAHDAENYVHDISVWDQSEEGTPIQVMLFFAKLHGKPITLTVWNWAAITRDFVLTVFGILVSYFVIVVQTFPSYPEP
ncbi:uncharacterized protein [Asterias amurensis]|uniref:uncharacterized protein n=1 Tax=Asterias amurensis TaxID=7602 RepID=UPI003AB5E925